jgi:hypothetical protein
MAKRMSMAERLKQSGSATVEKLDEAKKRLRNQSEEHSIEHSNEQSKEHKNGHSNGQSNSVADTLADTLADSRTVTLKGSPRNTQENGQKNSLNNTLTDGPGNNPYFWMTPNQAAVLYYLNTIPSGKTRLADICNDTGVRYGTVRKSLAALERNACITKPRKIRIGQWQGMHIELLDSGRRWITLKDSLKDTLKDVHHNSLTDGQSDGHSEEQSLISSSSYINKTTTMQNCASDQESIIDEIMRTDPEYTYWQEQQVSSAQVSAWKKEFGLNLQTILNNLCYVRWQILNQNVEINKSPAYYLYGIMKKTGGTVNKPSGYKSVVQQDQEYYESWKNQQIENARKIKQMKAEALKAKIAPKVEAILVKLDLENEFLKAALDQIKAKKRKQSIMTTIQAAKPLDEKSQSILKGYLEDILIRDPEALEYGQGD